MLGTRKEKAREVIQRAQNRQQSGLFPFSLFFHEENDDELGKRVSEKKRIIPFFEEGKIP